MGFSLVKPSGSTRARTRRRLNPAASPLNGSIALLTRFLVPSAASWVGVAAGIAGALVLTWLFYTYQRWRFADYDVRARQLAGTPSS
jgi:hypothetical protein